MAFNCSICVNVYSSARALRRHINEKHGDTRFKCDCGMDFSRNLTLNKHLENCKVGNNFSLNSDDNVVSNESDGRAPPIDSKFNSDISQNESKFNNNLLNSSDSNDGYITDDEDDSPVPKIRVKRFRKSKIPFDSSDEEDVKNVVRKPPRKRVKILVKSQDGSGSDSKRAYDRIYNYIGKSDIFSKNKNDSDESDSDDNESEVSDDELDSGESKSCHCRNCRKKSSKKNIKSKYVYPSESDSQSESGDDMEINMEKESDVKLETNPYNQYYVSQALGGRVSSVIIGNHTGANNVGGWLSPLYRSSVRIPATVGNGISWVNDSNYGNTAPVSSYLNY